MLLTDTLIDNQDRPALERSLEDDESKHWYVMRDLKRPNAKRPAYKQLEELGFEVFIPMKWLLVLKKGKRVREKIPVIRDLLFVHTTRQELDVIVRKTPTLQYRYVRGNAFRSPVTVPKTDMERFIRAVNASDNSTYYLPGELTSDMYGRDIRIVGGSLNGYEGKLLLVRGSKIKRLLVELQGFFSVGVKVEPEYVQLL